MQIKYFSTAWNDIRRSPGWLGKVLLLGLVACIPVFGWIVVFGYLYGWARDIAWGVHAPLPARIFGNEDGKLFSRGFFVLVIAFVFSLLPGVIQLVGLIIGSGPFLFWGGVGHGMGFLSVGMGFVIGLVSLASYFFAVLFAWIGAMRMSIYGRLSAGFQLGKIWAMARRDFGGLLRIVGMALVLVAGVTVACVVLAFGVVLVSMLVGFVVTGGNLNIDAPHLSGAGHGRGYWRHVRSALAVRVVCRHGGGGVRACHADACAGLLDAAVRRAGMARAGRPDAVRGVGRLHAAAVGARAAAGRGSSDRPAACAPAQAQGPALGRHAWSQEPGECAPAPRRFIASVRGGRAGAAMRAARTTAT